MVVMMKKGTNRAYNVWTEREEAALRAGVRRYGVGAWELIRQDKEYPVLKRRSGVQLKDKWRNLVKFRKLGEDELRGLPTRAGGPWSRRGSMRHQPHTDGLVVEGNVDAKPQVAETIAHVEQSCDSNCTTDENDATGKRRSVRTCARGPQRFDEFFTDFDGVDGELWGKKKVPRGGRMGRECRRLAVRIEDRRYGIYDARRYNQGLPNDGGYSGSSKLEIVAGAEEDESYVVDCPCGVTYDDGQMMIECELCKAWAHIRCLKEHMGCFMDPNDYDSHTYLCHKCLTRRTMTAYCVNTSNHDHGSNVSEEDIWHPLAGFDVPRKRRCPRRPRLDARSWCLWMRPLRTSSGAKRSGKVALTGEKSPRGDFKLGLGYGRRAFWGMGSGRLGPRCGYGDLEMLHAQLIASSEQFRFMPQNLAALALYTQALQCTTPDMQAMLPAPQLHPMLPQAMAAQLAQQMGLLQRAGSPCAMPPGMIAAPPLPKKLKREGSSISDCGIDFQREGFHRGSRGDFQHKAKA